MAPTYAANRYKLRPWQCVAGGFVVASVTVALFTAVISSTNIFFDNLVIGVGLCSAALSVVPVLVARLIARSDRQSDNHYRLRELLVACAAGLIVIATESGALWAHIWISTHFAQTRLGFWLFREHGVGFSVIFYGSSFLFCATLAAIFTRRVSQDEQEYHLSETHWEVMVALSEQRAARSESDILGQQIAGRKKAEVELARFAQRDSLTDLANRSYLLGALKRELKATPRNLAVSKFLMYIDLDRFRSVNDLLGHRAGDLLLKQVAARLQKCAHTDDILVRLSGDEFAIFLQRSSTADQAKRMAERILTAIEEPVNLNGIRFPMTASIGICEIYARYVEAENVLRDADTAMYRAKHKGGNQCVFYDTAMYDESLSTIQTTLQLKSAIDQSEFELFYQPFVNIANNSIYGVESLIRWHHPKRGLLSAGEFIQHIEDAGYSVPVGIWALRQACTDLQTIRRAARRDMIMSINVTNRQLDEHSFLDELKAIIKSSEVDPHLLQLEIIESAFLRDAERIGTLFRTIRDMGVRIALDDFGTGYSALGYLQKFPVDVLKIDQSFIRGMQKGSLNSSIVKFLVKLAESANMAILAEGVESLEHAEALLANGCRRAQGYLYSRPLPLNELLDLLQNGLDIGAIQTSVQDAPRY